MCCVCLCCTCSQMFVCQFLFLPVELCCLLSFLSFLSLSLYLSFCVALSFPLCGMCSFVQPELDCLLPGGERVMVLLSSHSEMDSSTKARVWAECIAWQKTCCWNAGSILKKQPQWSWNVNTTSASRAWQMRIDSYQSVESEQHMPRAANGSSEVLSGW